MKPPEQAKHRKRSELERLKRENAVLREIIATLADRLTRACEAASDAAEEAGIEPTE